jgi:hypothetical protein
MNHTNLERFARTNVMLNPLSHVALDLVLGWACLLRTTRHLLGQALDLKLHGSLDWGFPCLSLFGERFPFRGRELVVLFMYVSMSSSKAVHVQSYQTQFENDLALV